MTTTKTGWEREKRTHFDEIVTNYDKVRPSYPNALIEDIIKYSAPKKGGFAVEIGAGTGKATTPIISAGYDVTAVEAGANMAEFLSARFKGRDNFRVIESPFEEVSLEENSYDLLYAGSAFHWVDAEIGCPKAFRLLKKGGVIALFRYNVIPADGDPLYEEIQSAYDRHYRSYYTQKDRLQRKCAEELLDPDEIARGFGFRDLGAYGFTDVEMKLYSVIREFGSETLIDSLDTLADHRSLPDSNRTSLYAEVADAVIRHGGCYREHNVFQLYLGRKQHDNCSSEQAHKSCVFGT